MNFPTYPLHFHALAVASLEKPSLVKLFLFYLLRRNVEELSSSLDSRVAVRVQLSKVADDSSRNIVVPKVLSRLR